MRIFLPLLCLICALLWAALWLVQRHAGVDTERAQSLENALQAVEWYTNESVNKALRAEAEKDFTNASLFGDKAIESDLKAQGLRRDTANAWQTAKQPERARAVWQRAAKMAAARARMLADRIPPLQKQWEQARDSHLPSLRDTEVQYVQSLMYTAEQWALAVQFFDVAGDTDQATAAKDALRQVLQPLATDSFSTLLTNEPRLADSVQKFHQWQQLVLPASR